MKSTHNVKAYRNNMEATSGKAAYLGRYVTNENVPLSALCEQVAMYSGLTAIQARAIIEGSFDAIAELEKDGLVIVHLDGMSVWAVITGSFPTGDAAFDPERNSLVLAIRLDDSLRLSLANATAQMVTDADLAKVRLDNVKDVEVERPVNLIHGRHVFRGAGYNIVLDDEGARVYLTDRKGVEHEVVVDEVHSRQLFTAHTAELLEGGDYTLWVESRGGDAEGPLQKDGCRVKYLRVLDPEPIAQSSDGKVKVMSATGGGEGGAFTPDGDWTLGGEGLWGEFAEGRTWILSAPEVSAGGASYPATFGELAGGVAKVTLDHAPEEPGEYAAELSFSLTNVDPEVDSETLRVPFTLVVA